MPAHLRGRARFSKSERQYAAGGGGSWMRRRDVTIADAVRRVRAELERFGVLEDDFVISTNLQLRLDGLPRSDQREPDDPGVAVYWQRPEDKAMRCMAIDRYDRVADNLAAIAATLDAMRAIERHGGAQILDRAFTGFEALPAPGQTAAPGWREVLGFPALTIPTMAMVDEAYRRLAATHHPDKGGDASKFHAITMARQQARQELG